MNSKILIRVYIKLIFIRFYSCSQELDKEMIVLHINSWNYRGERMIQEYFCVHNNTIF
jgi:hypothetical protein